MYLQSVTVKNYGPMEDFHYQLPFKEDGLPKPVVFTGQNGAGKTLLFSNIVNSLVEIKRSFYNKLQEVNENNFFRVASKKYVTEQKPYCYESYKYDSASFSYIMVKNVDVYKKDWSEELFPEFKVNDSNLANDGFASKLQEPSDNPFEKGVYIFLPVERYYTATWENSANEKLKFNVGSGKFVGVSNQNIIKRDLFADIEPWILDIIIDKVLYESPRNNVGINTMIQSIINIVLTTIFRNKGYSSVRFGIARKEKGYRKINISGVKSGALEESEIVPSFSNFSSGEMMVFGMAAAILKEIYTISNGTISQEVMNEVSGIVIIDEVDMHLHSDLMKDVLPVLFTLFPKIQFIVSSHSPFFLIGMQETFGSNCEFVSMPTGTIFGNIKEFEEIRKWNELADKNFNELEISLRVLREKLQSVNRPLVITEGKTDWKHLKHALKGLQNMGEFTDLDVEFLEYSDDLGDSKLEKLLENISKVPHVNKIIGVFDNDSKIGLGYSGIKAIGNNVFGCCISDVNGYGCGVSIELLYKRSDLQRTDVEGRRIYLSDEFYEKSHQLCADTSIICTNNDLVYAFKNEMVKVIDKGVYNSAQVSLALSKEEFAAHIFNEDENFVDIDVTGFRDILKTITEICSR